MQRCTPDKHKINRTNLITIIIDDDDVTTVRWVVCWNQCSSENHYTCVWTCARICAIVFWWFRTEMIESARIIAGNVYWGWMQRWAARSVMPKVWNPAAVQLIGRKNIRVWMEPTLMIAKYTHLLSIGYLNLRAAVYIYMLRWRRHHTAGHMRLRGVLLFNDRYMGAYSSVCMKETSLLNKYVNGCCPFRLFYTLL